MNLQLSRCNGHIKLTHSNSRAFYGVPEMQKPQQNDSVTAHANLVESLKLKGVETFQSQISTAVTV